MKILELRFKNLNSLYGEWIVDFTRPEYFLDGIFVITGPTGAGKSTILDAICLALYGRTPRLKSISTNANEIMSRQTGECFAQVIFETGSGRFQCHWGQHKARKKPDGNLIDSKHEISDAKTGKILESKKRDVATRIEKETGMDFERFTRSMMLAQGGFAAFLEAAPDERAPILEQITGTKIYSEISKLVHERKSNENRKLELLQAQTDGIAVLSSEEETAVREELISKQEIEDRENQKNENIGKSILVLERINGLEKELTAIDKESEKLSKAFRDFESEREKLNNGLKAAELASEYAGLISKREQQDQDIKTLDNAGSKIPDLEKDLNIKEKNRLKAEESALLTKESFKKESLTIQKVRELDLTIAQKQALLKTVISNCKDTQILILQKRDEQNKIKSSQKTENKNLDAVEKYLSSCSNDSMLVSQLTGIREQVQSFENSLRDLEAVESREIKSKEQLDINISLHKREAALYSKLKRECDSEQNRELKRENSIKELLKDRLLREYQSEYSTLLKEMAYLNKIARLEDEREKLSDDKPCPLCGALDHPFARGNTPKIDQTQEKIDQLSGLIEKVENLNMELEKNRRQKREKEISLGATDKKLARVLYKKDESEANVNNLAKQRGTASLKHTQLQNKLLLNLQPFGFKQLPDINAKSISDILEARLEKWQDKEVQKNRIKERLDDLNSTLKSLDAVLETLKASLKERETLADNYQKELEEIKEERRKLYEKKDPDREESRLESLVAAAEKFEKSKLQKRDVVKESLDEIRIRITALKESTGQRKYELDNLESKFKASRGKRGFNSEKSFILYRLPSQQRAFLEQKAKDLDARKADIASHKKDRETRLTQEKEKKIIQQPFETLKKEQEKIKTSLKTLGQEIGAIKQKLAENADAKKKIEEKTDLIDAQKKECARWDALHLLIGSADGKKFRNFAQGLTFELMVSHANLQLEKMSDRYLLIRDKKRPLELNIVDDFQAGEIRSTNNLSGGESFVVSLALALGLSNMASRNVRVDSLFLDEGFGTLDEDALETSLEALAGLHQKGKLIGVISHVSALKERIATQINIMPLSGGKSTITGPGCKSAV